MKRTITLTLLVISAVVLAGSSASAFSFDDIGFWTGSGSKQAAMVIYWNSPEVFNNTTVNPPIEERCMAWGYRFDGDMKGEDMFNAVLAADSRLFAVVSGTTQYGKAIFGLGYDLDNDGVYGLTDGYTTYDSSAFSNGLVTTSYDDNDTMNSLDSSDLYWGGWYGPNWELWHEQDGNGGFDNAPDRGSDPYWTGNFFAGSHGEWDFSEVGISGIDLQDGSWVGWSVAAGGLDMGDYEGEGTTAWMTHKQAPILPEAVPEPSGILALVSGTVGLIGLAAKRRA